MKFFLSYLKYRLRIAAAAAVCWTVLLAVFLLSELPLGALMYSTLLCAVVIFLFALVDIRREYKKHKLYRRIDSAAVVPALPAPGSVCEQDCIRIIKLLSAEAEKAETDGRERYNNMIEYYTVWAHQIKTPIAAMRLDLQNEDSALSRRLGAELFRIEQYVEMVMAFLRLDSDFTDYVFKSHDVDRIIRESLKRFAGEFISRRLQLRYEPTGICAVTDDKWLGFVIEQVLSNALKYTREGSVKIYAEGSVLCIADTGIGIADEDLPRIFDRGYTGCNGRSDKSASGLGLYLCRRICDNLGVRIRVRSKPMAGTCVCIDLSQNRADE